jgi:hypothetical protein
MRTLLAGLALAIAFVALPEVASHVVRETLGSIGSVVAKGQATKLPDGYTGTPSSCPTELAEARAVLPDLDTAWFWSDLTSRKAGGQYFPGRNTIVMSSALPCKYVSHVATHETMHAIQDRFGLQDRTIVGGFNHMEYVAECAARVISYHHGWQIFDSYPELGGFPCEEFSSDVQKLLDLS